MKPCETVKVKHRLLKRKLIILREVSSTCTFILRFMSNYIAKKMFPIKLKTNVSAICFVWNMKPPPMIRPNVSLNKMNRWG